MSIGARVSTGPPGCAIIWPARDAYPFAALQPGSRITLPHNARHLTAGPIAAAALVLLALCAPARPARALDVTFQVHMRDQVTSGVFHPATDFVDVAGSFNGWGSPLTQLADAEGDTVYAVTIAGFTAGQFIEYKFRLNGLWDGTEEFPGVGNNRNYTVADGANLIDVWYNVRELGGGGADGHQVPELHWWNDAVFYEVFVRSFKDGNGDGIGDLKGLTEKLDYLNDGNPATHDDLGVTAIWLMPVNASPSYHGYDVTDYRAIEPDYGTLADFQAFLAAAHARGIRVIMDFVMNHCSNQNPWFVSSRANAAGWRDWFRWSATNPGGTGPWGQSVWWRSNSAYFYGLFGSGMPDLNYDTPAVKNEMFSIADYWLDTVGVDGFRLDAVLYIDEDPGALMNTPGTLQFWQDFNTRVESVAPEAMTVGEAWTTTAAVAPYSASGRLDLCFEFDLSGAIVGAANGGDAGWLGTKLGEVCGTYRYPQWGTFLSNHDQDRVFSQVGQDAGRARVAAGLCLTLPGVPFLYYGEELGMTGTTSDPVRRAPMQWSTAANSGFTTATPWESLGGNWTTNNVALESADSGSLLSWYRRLVAARTASPALRRGTCATLTASSAPVLAFVRRDTTEAAPQVVLCLVNTSTMAQGAVSLTAPAGVLAPGSYRGTDLIDPNDVRTFTVDAGGHIANLGLDSQVVKAFVLTPLATPVVPTPPRTGLLLEQNRPNPFNPSTSVRFVLAEPGRVRIAVYDVRGRELAVLLDEDRPAGAGDVSWQGRDKGGREVGAGVYFVRGQAGQATRLVKATLVK